MPCDKVRVAVVGCGIFGSIHAVSYAQCRDAELRCVCDLDARRAKKAARQYGCAWTTNSAEIARDKSIAAVSIATPDFAHRALALQMIRAGKHVLIEKPLATSMKDARAIVAAARKARVKLMVDFHNRWSPPFVAARQAVDAGKLGEPVVGYARLSNTWDVPMKWLSWSGRSGPHWFLFPHLLDLVRWLYQQEAVEVFATGTKGHLKKKGIDCYDAVQAQVTYTKGFATAETCWVLPRAWPSVIDFKLDLVGSKGKIDVVCDNQGLVVTAKRYETPFLVSSLETHGRRVGFMHLPMEHFVQCVQGDTEPHTTGHDGLVNVATIEAIEQSIRTRRMVKVRV